MSKKTRKTFENFVVIRIKNHVDKNGGHSHVILEDFEDKHVSVGLTSKAKKGKNAPNYKCETDILGTGKNSYMRRQGTVAPIKDYSKKERKAKMSHTDFAKAKVYGAKAKQKYLDKRNK